LAWSLKIVYQKISMELIPVEGKGVVAPVSLQSDLSLDFEIAPNSIVLCRVRL
jgi:hypothetical protein